MSHTPTLFSLRNRVSAVIAAASLGLGSNALASPYAETVFLGDSLSDSGVYQGFLGAGASFTTNPDPVWAVHLARALGGNADPAWKLGLFGAKPRPGSDYAVGGARIATQDGYPNRLLADRIPTLNQQVSALLGRQPRLNGRGLYATWAGANDVLASLESQAAALANPGTQGAALQKVLMDSSLAARAGVMEVGRLHDAGAGTVLVLNLPDIGQTPMGRGSPAGPAMSLASRQFNDALNSGLAGYRGNLVVLDIHGMFEELMRRPGRFGLSNVTSAACTAANPLTGEASALFCTRNTLVEPNANQTYLFADALHPSGMGHQLVNDYVLSVLQAPSRIGLLAEAPLAGNRAGLSVIEDRLRTRDANESVQVYASYQHGNDRQRSDSSWKPGLGNNLDMLVLGVDAGLNPYWTIGAAAAQIRHDATLGENAGSFRLGQTQLSLYARYYNSGWSAALVGSASYLDYRKISRDFSIGPARLSEQGKTTGAATSLSALTHYDWDLGSLTLTPTASLTLQHVDVDAFNESRDGARTATSMNYQEQQRRSLSSSLGLVAQTRWRAGGYLLRPFASVAWDHEYDQDPRRVRAHVRDMAGGFSQVIAMPPPDTLRTSVGISVSGHEAWSGQMSYHGRYGSGFRSHAVLAVLTKAF